MTNDIYDIGFFKKAIKKMIDSLTIPSDDEIQAVVKEILATQIGGLAIPKECFGNVKSDVDPGMWTAVFLDIDGREVHPRCAQHEAKTIVEWCGRPPPIDLTTDDHGIPGDMPELRREIWVLYHSDLDTRLLIYRPNGYGEMVRAAARVPFDLEGIE